MSLSKQDWARDQLRAISAPQDISTAILRLLEVWWTQNHSPATAASTLDAFSTLAQGHALAVDDVAVDEQWVDAKMGQIVVSNIVRVKHDAYAGEPGLAHNGRRGVVVAIRYGDIIVDYRDGKMPEGRGVHHPALKLQRRVR